MITVEEAQRIVIDNAEAAAPAPAPLSTVSLGLVIAEDVVSDIDMPPFDKAMMDGYAVRSEDCAATPVELRVIEEIYAGDVPSRAVERGTAARIMTGAPMPDGADAVVMVEHTQAVDGGCVRIDAPATPGQNVIRKGSEMRKGEVVLLAGTVLRPQEFGLLATIGRIAVQAYPRPRVAILATGNEIVEPTQTPAPGQIRNSNAVMLAAQVSRASGIPRVLGIVRDEVEALEKRIAEGLGYDILLLTGGVSAGAKDLVPGVLERMGVERLFHKVDLKPGKPAFFGKQQRTLVFGLPGNPVSSFVCFELFVRPAIGRMLGRKNVLPPIYRGVMTKPLPITPTRGLTYYPCRIEWCEENFTVTPVAWSGSADLRGFAGANGLIVLAKSTRGPELGETVSIMPFECP